MREGVQHRHELSVEAEESLGNPTWRYCEASTGTTPGDPGRWLRGTRSFRSSNTGVCSGPVLGPASPSTKLAGWAFCQPLAVELAGWVPLGAGRGARSQRTRVRHSVHIDPGASPESTSYSASLWSLSQQTGWADGPPFYPTAEPGIEQWVMYSYVGR